MAKLLAIDPGKTIGFAIADISEFGIHIITIDQDVTVDWNPYGTRVMGLMDEADEVVIEDFLGNGARTKESCHTIKMIGAFKLKADQRGISIKQKAPGVRMKYLKRGEEATGRNLVHHGKDAWAHLLRECADQGINYTEVELKWI